MPETPLISIVIPNYNRSAVLVRAIRSVLGQAEGAVEVIVVDDGSDRDLSGPYAMLAAQGVRVLRMPERRTGSHARNVGVAAATGSHVSFLDSDDVWLPGRLDRLRALLPELAADRVLVSGALIYQWGEVTGGSQPPWPDGLSPADFIYRDGGRLQTSMLTLPRDIARAHPFREDLRVNQDSDFAMRLHVSGVRFHLDPEPGVIKDESDSADRLSRDTTTVDLSYDWFRSVSSGWSPAAIRGYYVQDRAWRLIGAGRRREALLCLLRGTLPPVAPGSSARIAAEAILGRAGYARLRAAFRGRVPRPPAPAGSTSALVWFEGLDADARALVAAAQAVAPDPAFGTGPGLPATPPAA